VSLIEALQAFFIQYGFDRTYWVAYSGGLDSHVLLSLCHQVRAELPIKHGISPHATLWGQHCAQVCKKLSIDYKECFIQVEVGIGQSLEEEARQKRYTLFEEHIHANDILLTAHQEDDQAETFLLQLFRGAGLKGLAAMPIIKPLGMGFHARPLLAFSRETLHHHALSQHLKWIEDESNLDQRLARNFTRHTVLPLLKTRWPSIAKTLSRSAQHCAEAQTLLDDYALNECLNLLTLPQNTLSVSQLLTHSVIKQKLLLRTWIHKSGYLLPSAKKLETILKDMLLAKGDRMPCVTWDNGELRRYRDQLYLLKKRKDLPSQKSYLWDFTGKLILPGLGLLEAKPAKGDGLRADINAIEVCFRKGGERLPILQRGHQSLKILFQEWGIPPWQRSYIPLIYLGEVLIAVVGHYIHPNFKAVDEEMGRSISLIEAS
jgi:tRNA(Ile)-lysidine synthase